MSEEEQEHLSGEPEGFLTQLLAEEGAPDPNELIVHRLSDDTTDGLIQELIHQVESMTSSGGHPPAAAIYHEESAHIRLATSRSSFNTFDPAPFRRELQPARAWQGLQSGARFRGVAASPTSGPTLAETLDSAVVGAWGGFEPPAELLTS